MPDIAILSVEDVLHIHEILVADFARSNDPISPAGVRDLGLLESAVGRQLTGARGVLKYTTPTANAATLLYGICNDHAFHNGNKRTALVAMLVHLDKNSLTLMNTSQNELFDMILNVAAHSILAPKRTAPGTERRRTSSDAEVAAVDDWIRKRAAKPHRGERQVTYRELRRLLARHGFGFANNNRGNSITIYRDVEEKRLFRKPQTLRKSIGAIGYRDEGTFLSLKDLKLVRKLCRLTEDYGVDSNAFYDQEAIIDSFINRYRNALKRLSKR